MYNLNDKGTTGTYGEYNHVLPDFADILYNSNTQFPEPRHDHQR
jgi:hypothetical protein